MSDPNELSKWWETTNPHNIIPGFQPLKDFLSEKFTPSLIPVVLVLAAGLLFLFLTRNHD